MGKTYQNTTGSNQIFKELSSNYKIESVFLNPNQPDERSNPPPPTHTHTHTHTHTDTFTHTYTQIHIWSPCIFCFITFQHLIPHPNLRKLYGFSENLSQINIMKLFFSKFKSAFVVSALTFSRPVVITTISFGIMNTTSKIWIV